MASSSRQRSGAKLVSVRSAGLCGLMARSIRLEAVREPENHSVRRCSAKRRELSRYPAPSVPQKSHRLLRPEIQVKGYQSVKLLVLNEHIHHRSTAVRAAAAYPLVYVRCLVCMTDPRARTKPIRMRRMHCALSPRSLRPHGAPRHEGAAPPSANHDLEGR